MGESIEKEIEIPSYCSKAAFLQVLDYLCFDNLSAILDHVVLLELWELADMYQLEGLKLSCLGTLETCRPNFARG